MFATMKLLGYTRVSTDDQTDQMQRDALIRYGVSPDMIWTDTMTGARMDRPGLKRVINVARKGDKLVVWKLDRLGRSTVGVLDAVESMTADGVELVSISENIDTATPMGKMFLTLAAAFAQLERDLIAERTAAGIAAYKARGGRMGKPHFIRDYPKRMALFRQMVADGLIQPDGRDALTAREIVDRMHAADPDGQRVKGTQSYYNWKSAGFPGFEPDTPLDQVAAE